MARLFDGFLRVSYVFDRFLGSLVLLPIWILACATNSGISFLLEIIKLIYQGKIISFPSATTHFPMILYDHLHSCGTVNSLHNIKLIALQNSWKDVIWTGLLLWIDLLFFLPLSWFESVLGVEREFLIIGYCRTKLASLKHIERFLFSFVL